MSAILSIPAELEAIDRARIFLNDNIGRDRLSEDDLFQLDLALVELLVNIVRYGYPKGSGEIRLKLNIDSEGIQLEIRDHGVPFNPGAAPDPSVDDILAGERKGGLGIHLARKFTDGMTYRRNGAENVLILTKAFSK